MNLGPAALEGAISGLLARHGALTLRELATTIGVPVATVERVVRQLARDGVVRRCERGRPPVAHWECL